MTDDQLQALAMLALEHDFDPVPWDEAPAWRRTAMAAAARAAVETSALTVADNARSAWFLSMTMQGWRWGHVLDERERTHPGIVTGELTRGGTAHWHALAVAVRERARVMGVRVME